MKIAICFWGLTRSLKYTIKSIHKHIFDVFKNSNIEYKIFMHTYKVNSLYSNPRAKEYNIMLENEEYKLLEPDYYTIDLQEEVEKKLDFKSYRTFKDPWNTNYKTMDNFILAMYSKKKLLELINNSEEIFTHFLCVRPDVKYLNSFDIKWLYNINNNDIYIPDFHQYHFGFNDRMALITNKKILDIYLNIFDYMKEYSKNNMLHSETCIRYILKKNIINLNIISIPFYFNRVRANGIMIKDIQTINSI